MNLEQVKEHFENAKEVKCLTDGQTYNMDVNGQYGEDGSGYIDFDFESEQKGNDFVALYYKSKLAEIISCKDTNKPEPEKNKYPKEGKVMLVSNSEKNWLQRVVFIEKNNKFVAWSGVETIEEAKNQTHAVSWKYAKELPKKVKVTKEEIAEWKGCDVNQLIIR